MSTSETGLNNCLKRLGDFCETWQMVVNMKKSQVIIFNKSGRKLTGSKFTFLNKPMEVVNKYCYLGIDRYPSGSFRTSVANLMNKARKAMSPLFSTIAQFQLPCSNGISLFNSLIKPICIYNAENLSAYTMQKTYMPIQCRKPICLYNAENLYAYTMQKTYMSIQCRKPICLYNAENLYVYTMQKTYMSIQCRKPICLCNAENLYVYTMQKTYMSIQCRKPVCIYNAENLYVYTMQKTYMYIQCRKPICLYNAENLYVYTMQKTFMSIQCRKPICIYNAEHLAPLSRHQIESLQEKRVSLLSYMMQAEHSKVQLKFMKFMLGVNRNCSNIATLGEVGEFPLYLNGLAALLSFWHRVANLPVKTLVNQALNAQTREDHDSEWLATVKFLLSELNLYEHYANPALASGDQFSKICKTKIKELFLQQWNAHLMGLNIDHPQSSKLGFYKLFKTNFIRGTLPYRNL